VTGAEPLGTVFTPFIWPGGVVDPGNGAGCPGTVVGVRLGTEVGGVAEPGGVTGDAGV